MRKKRKQISIILFLLLIISFLLLLDNTRLSEKKTYNISIIARGKNSESLMIMKKGIDQAALEMDLNISVITLSEENKVREQTKLIEQEIGKKADAIIIDPVDYEKMTEPIENAMKKVPFILIGSKVNSEWIQSSISCDNYKLGVSLGEKMIEMGNVKANIVIVKNNLECSSIKERYNGFMSVMNGTENTFINWEFVGEEQQNYYFQAKKLLEDNDIDTIVIFDTAILEMVAQEKQDLRSINKEKTFAEIYGTGSTNKIISFIEDKVISATAIQNEYNIGYLGVEKAVDIINRKRVNDKSIASTVITKNNMYSEENQRLLFPFIR